MPLTLLSAGSNAHGQLGHSLNEDSTTFLPCGFEGSLHGNLPNGTSKILDIATGANHTVVLLEMTPTDHPGTHRREVWGCGDGRAGQLGPWPSPGSSSIPANLSDVSVFRRLDLPLKNEGLQGYQFKLIAAGWETTYLVLSPPSDDSSQHQSRGDVILSMGADEWGDLGIRGKNPPNNHTKRDKGKGKRTTKALNRVTFDHLFVDGTAMSSCGVLAVVSIAAHQHHVVAHLRAKATRKGFLVGWGASRHGQISLLSDTASTTTIQSAAISDHPQLVHEEDLDDPYLTCSVGSQHSIFLTASGKPVGIGSNRKGQLDISSWRDISAIGCTWNSTFAVVSRETDGSTVVATGSNTHGQLGLAHTETTIETTENCDQPVFPNALRHRRLTKLACGSEHVLTLWGTPSCEVPPEVWSWGWNEHGNLGIGTTGDAHAPVKVYPNSTGSWDVVDVWGGSGTSWICCDTRE